MTELRFDGRVAVVTGAGRGIGREYARLLAARGAAVVVNDLGASVDGGGADATPATAVAGEIIAAGGAARPDTNDVASADGAAALVDVAVSEYGRVDILVANAGIVRWAGFPDVDEANLADHLAVHVGGSFNTVRAAWPHMVEQAHGRIVLTTSTGVFGVPNNTAYATAKAAVIGLARSAAVAGRRHGIKVNCIAPAASTRMAGDGGPDLPPALVAPMAAFLAHDECPVTGEIYTAGGGRFARLFIGSTPGYSHPAGAPTVEDVAANWHAINDESGYSVPATLLEWSRTFVGDARYNVQP